MSKPLFSRKPAERRAEANAYTGRAVVVTVDPFRDGTNLEELAGLVVAVAIPNAGSVADQLIVRPAAGAARTYCHAISLATVRAIELEEDHARRRRTELEELEPTTKENHAP